MSPPVAKSIREERFAIEYLKDHNATRAAVRCGYAPSGAAAKGTEMLSRATVRTLIDEKLREVNVTAMRVLAELVKIAYSDIADYSHLMDSEAAFSQSRFESLELGISRAIKSVTEHRKTLKTPGSKEGVKLIESWHKIELHDKMKALELLIKILGMTDKTASEESNGTLQALVQVLSGKPG